MNEPKKDKRKYIRYDTTIDVYYAVEFDFETKVEYQKVDQKTQKAAGEKYNAVSKNVSVEGLAFRSDQLLFTGDILNLEVFLPSIETPIYMRGIVCWSTELIKESHQARVFETGVKILSVNGQPVHETIYFDEEYKIYWSTVLESILGKFREVGFKLAQERRAGPK